MPVVFPYILVTDFPKHQKRIRSLPWIRFGIFNPKNPDVVLYPLGLVDSGADITTVEREFGEQLGYSIEKGKKDKIFGVGGSSITTYFHNVGLLVEDLGSKVVKKYSSWVGFTFQTFPKSMPQQTAILGRLGFFDKFGVTFNHSESITIT